MPHPNDYEEKDLLHRLKNDDRNAFIAIYEFYRQPLRAYIFRYVKAPAYAEDILQDVFLKLWEIRSRINPDLSFKAYLYRITRNLVYKFLKKIASDESLVDTILHHYQPDEKQPQLKLEWKEYEQKISEAILQLPPKRQIVFVMCREQNKTYDEVATELGISRNTVKEHMVLAMKNITEYLKSHSGIQLPLLAILLSAN